MRCNGDVNDREVEIHPIVLAPTGTDGGDLGAQGPVASASSSASNLRVAPPAPPPSRRAGPPGRRSAARPMSVPPPPPPGVPRQTPSTATLPVEIHRGTPGTPKPKTDPNAPAIVERGARAVFLGGYVRDIPAWPQDVRIPEHETLEIGSKPGTPFAADPHVSRYHAALVPAPDGVIVEDFGTANGVYRRVETPVPLGPTTRLRIGRQLLELSVFGPSKVAKPGVRLVGSPDPGWWGRLDLLIDDAKLAAALPLGDDELVIGRATAGLPLSGDDLLALRHFRLTRLDGTRLLEDLGSKRGTWVRIKGGDLVPYGCELLVGETRFRVEPR